MKRAQEAKGALQQYTDNLKTAQAYRESCMQHNGKLPRWAPIMNFTGSTQKLYPRQVEGVMHTILPGWAVFTGIDDIFVEMENMVHSAMLGERPRNCTQTDQCYHHTRQIKVNLNEQQVNMTNAATKLRELAEKNAQCTREKLEDDYGGLIGPDGYLIPDPDPISIERRGSDEKIWKELYVPFMLQTTRCITDNLQGWNPK